MLNAPKHYIHRNGIRLAYECAGSGPGIVLVQGLGMPGLMWMKLGDELVKAGFRVVIPDNRGTGESDAPNPPYRMSVLADDVAWVIKHADLGPSIVVGISFGGMVAQQLALRHPALVRGLVLAATTCGMPSGKLARPAVLWMMTKALTGDMRAARRFRRHLVHGPNLDSNPKLLHEWDSLLATTRIRWQGVVGQLSAAATHSTCRLLTRIECPVEVLTGDSDEIIPSINAKIIASRIPGAKLTVLPRAGHAFPIELPGALLEAVHRVHQRST